MKTYIALLRGINVGNAKRVAMADLRRLVTNMGYGGARTLLNSGNLVFTAKPSDCAKLASRIEAGIEAELGVVARVMVLSAEELEVVIQENPLPQAEENPARFLVAVFGHKANRTKLPDLATQDWRPEAFAEGTHAVYLWCANGILESKLLVAVGKALGSALTTRNWSTIIKLQGMLKS